MLDKLFNYDNPVLRFVIKLGNCWLLNILWLISSIPIITIGASSTALIYSCMKLRKDEGSPAANFFRSFKENFVQSTVIWVIYAFAGICIAAGLIYWNHADTGEIKPLWALFFAAAIVYTVSLSYVFAVQSRFINPVWKTVAYSFLLPVRNMKYTVPMLILIIGFIYINMTTVFAVNFMSINLGFGILAYILSGYYQRIFEKYI